MNWISVEKRFPDSEITLLLYYSDENGCMNFNQEKEICFARKR